MSQAIKDILNSNDPVALKSLFSFNSQDSDDAVLVKFNLWARWGFAQYFSSPDADFHKEMDRATLELYRGKLIDVVDAAFRGAAKTARRKLFRAFVICNDMEHIRKFLKVSAEDGDNSKQIVTDVYNMLVSPKIKALYPELWEKTDAKRQETMSTFTTATSVKLLANTVGVDQRGSLQDESRPDEIWFEDFENKTTLRSGRKTKTISENMEEARTGLAKGGGCLYTCNYLSESGNVHALISKHPEVSVIQRTKYSKQYGRKVIMVTPIEDELGNPTWARYSKTDIQYMRETDDDFEGERLCKPSASKDVLFDRDALDKQVPKTPIREVAGFKIFKPYNPSHRYGSGHDIAGGVQLDSSTSVFIDFDTVPAQVVGTFRSNTIKPDTFGDEIKREQDIFPGLAGIEKNNHGHATIARAKQLDLNMYFTQPKDTKTGAATNDTELKEYGWHTNALSKSKMLFALAKACDDGLIELNDPDVIAECKSYTRNDLIDNERDPRLTTRHFDFLIAAAIAWQLKDFAEVATIKFEEIWEEKKPLYPHIGI